MSHEPTTLGRFQVLAPLGQGAMGRVYLAEDPSLKRRVAIKVIQAGGFGQEEALRRFQQEAEISARLNHPNLITVFEVGQDPDLGPFLVMEFVDGEGLDALLKRGPLPPEQAMDILIQAMEGLEAAHSRGIIHRDIKPANFLLDRDGRVRLTDFGIARGSDTTRTFTSGFVGSPAYAAPELLQEFQANTATDNWSFAVTAFKCLTGRLPFQGENLSATLYHVAHGDLALPRDMDRRLAAVFRRALDRDPSHRPRDPKHFLAELLHALELPNDVSIRFQHRLGLPAQGEAGPEAPPAADRRGLPRTWVVGGGLGAALLGALAWWGARGPGVTGLSLESDPPGAQVRAGAALYGRTPLSGVRVPPGTVLRFELEDHWPLEQKVGAGAAQVKARLVPTPYFVDVATEPKGAFLSLDGRPVGRSPQRLQVPGEGRHELEVSAPGHRTVRFPLQRRQALPDPIRLAREPGGK